MSDLTNCDRCQASLERGWSMRYRNNKLFETMCFECDDNDQIDRYEKTKILTSRITMLAAMNSVRCDSAHPAIMAAVWASATRIQEEIKVWERAVWFKGLQKAVLATDSRGFRLDFPGGQALVYSLAGRTQITIETVDESAQVSLITADDEPTPVMGQNSILATEDQALGLLVASRTAFTSGTKFQRNDKVGIGL